MVTLGLQILSHSLFTSKTKIANVCLALFSKGLTEAEFPLSVLVAAVCLQRCTRSV